MEGIAHDASGERIVLEGLDCIAKGPRQNLVFDVYTRLSAVAAPLVKTVAFCFDRENLSVDQMNSSAAKAAG